jgi:predicted DNA-binding transcriptional regulator YafY
VEITMKDIVIDYTNWRGERSTRVITPKEIVWGHNEWHKEPQWLMLAHDYNSGEERSFAMLGIHACQKLNAFKRLNQVLQSKPEYKVIREYRNNTWLLQIEGSLADQWVVSWRDVDGEELTVDCSFLPSCKVVGLQAVLDLLKR